MPVNGSTVKSNSDILTALVRASVELALTRHPDILVVNETENDDVVRHQILEVACETANAVHGVDTCAGEPIPELIEALKIAARSRIATLRAAADCLGDRKYDGLDLRDWMRDLAKTEEAALEPPKEE